MPKQQEYIPVDIAARQTGLKPHTIRRCIQVGLVSKALTEDDLAELRRVRRLTEMEVNLAGVEIIVRMHHQIVELRSELSYLRTLIAEHQEGAK
jgi:DNA-binding transcriptional MerR regulator